MDKITLEKKTVEEAILEGLKLLGAKREDVIIHVEEEGQKGFLGLIGGKDAKVTIVKKGTPDAALYEDNESDSLTKNAATNFINDAKESVTEKYENSDFKENVDEAKEKVSDFADDAKKKIESFAEDTKAKVMEVTEVVRNEVSNFKDDVKDSFDDTKEKVSDFAEDAKEKISETTESVKEKVSEVKEEAREDVAKFKDDAKESLEDTREKVNDKIDDIKGENINSTFPQFETKDEAAEASRIFLEDMMHKMGYAGVVEVIPPIEEDENYVLDIIPDDFKMNSRFIGKKGDTLSSIGYLVNVFLRNRFQADMMIEVDCGDYIYEKQEDLKSFARMGAERALNEGEYKFRPMNAYDRRLVHREINKIEGVTTHSEGEEPRRRIVVQRDPQ
ncbi:R3H domain-containing nucleic acid-binding protein [Ezakiella coagulans]|uniref:R3H domain-containing nucleic acid-binding protein n=1 Tax=Ezakiella coagulans TaxID=46507 RepID=UPI002014B780|nr:R3H domain-containing nucleic acid-binding protein [Ezakiella coagulans]UQK60169.1 Jag N-terminal domain-containing protein [Ezakiella coagulans]